MDVLVFAMCRNQSLTSFGILAITDSIHVLPDAVMVCFSLNKQVFQINMAFGLILMWHLA